MDSRDNQRDNTDDDNRYKPMEGESLIHPLPQDNDTPFSAPTDPIDDASEELDERTKAGELNPNHQVTDTNVDSHEMYDEGISGAAEAEEPNASDVVINYNPDNDKRKETD